MLDLRYRKDQAIPTPASTLMRWIRALLSLSVAVTWQQSLQASADSSVCRRANQLPQRYSDGTLVDAMQNARGFVKDQALRERLKEAKRHRHRDHHGDR
jgi:hypothetical protein